MRFYNFDLTLKENLINNAIMIGALLAACVIVLLVDYAISRVKGKKTSFIELLKFYWKQGRK